MGKVSFKDRLGFVRMLIALLALLTPLVPQAASAAGGDRTLYLYYTHTKETKKITFRRNGKYDQKGLAELNKFLRDWRRNEPTKMDPALFDLVWEVYRDSKATGPIHIVSAYRAPATNEMLRSRSNAVAKNSRHTMGMAMDFFIPGVKISDLRQIAMKKQVGGVGYYPTSGSPFVHLDTGNVRAWPRMTRAQLQKVFPDGRTLHVPNDGTPISSSGYAYAKAQWTKCHSVPCSGRDNTIRVASSDDGAQAATTHSGGTLLGWLFGAEPDDSDDEGATTTIVATAPVKNITPTAPPIPVAMPVSLRTATAQALSPIINESVQIAAIDNVPGIPQARPTWLGTSTLPAQDTQQPAATIAIAALDNKPFPAPRQLFSKPASAAPSTNETLLAAYAPAMSPEPDAQRAVQMLIERRNQQPASLSPQLNTARLNTEGMRIATAATSGEINTFASLFTAQESLTTGGLSLPGTPTTAAKATMPTTMLPAGTFEVKAAELVAPDLEHVIDIFVDPSAISSDRYAIIFDHDEADFSPQTALGGAVTTMTFSHTPSTHTLTDRFRA